VGCDRGVGETKGTGGVGQGCGWLRQGVLVAGVTGAGGREGHGERG
jgi:hypothetical protein